MAVLPSGLSLGRVGYTLMALLSQAASLRPFKPVGRTVCMSPGQGQREGPRQPFMCCPPAPEPLPFSPGRKAASPLPPGPQRGSAPAPHGDQ